MPSFNLLYVSCTAKKVFVYSVSILEALRGKDSPVRMTNFKGVQTAVLRGQTPFGKGKFAAVQPQFYYIYMQIF